MQIQDYDTNERFNGKVVGSRRITAENTVEVRELTIDITAPNLRLSVGQSLAVLAPPAEGFGQEFHTRLYSVADLPSQGDGGATRIKICVRRCDYVDEYSGEHYPGVASNYLCDLTEGAEIALSGPFGLPFEVPEHLDANLVLIATSTGIAPFRSFVRHIYENVPEFQGRVWLFYGAHTGLDMLYLNDEANDFEQYYDEPTFEAFKALSARPHWDATPDWSAAIAAHGGELWKMLAEPKTYVYVAGVEKITEQLDKVLDGLGEVPEEWKRRKAELSAGGRWVELLY